MKGPVISDTGPFIHLAEADRLSLLAIFESLHVPATVRDELSSGTVPDGFDALPIVIHECESAGYPTLDPGESAALNLCNELDGLLLTDDLEAREIANEDDVEVHGTIGVVLLAYSRGELNEKQAKDTLRDLKRDTTLYLADPLVEHAIELVEDGDTGW